MLEVLQTALDHLGARAKQFDALYMGISHGYQINLCQCVFQRLPVGLSHKQHGLKIRCDIQWFRGYRASL